MNLNDFDINMVLDKLSESRKIFHNERDFQFSLAWLLKELYGASVRLEYCCPEMENGKRSYIDLVINDEKNCILFELKYKTIRKDLYDTNGEEYHLQNHGARDLGCYYVLNDLSRIEKHLINQKTINGKRISKAYSILLTNDEKYKSGFRKNALFYNFGFTEGKQFAANTTISFIIPDGQQKDNTCASTLHEITLSNDYQVHWKTYSSELSLLIFEVNNAKYDMKEE